MKFLFALLFLGSAFRAMCGVPDEYTEWLEKLEKYQHRVRVVITNDTTKYHNFVEGHLDTTTFNLGKYMLFFSSLRVKPGYIIDYSDNYARDGGRPRLYARKSDLDFDSLLNKEIERNHHYWDSVLMERLQLVEQDSISKEKKEERRQKYTNMMKGFKLNERTAKMSFAADTAYDAKHFLIPADTPMGYFQLLVYHVIGDNFGLYWHAYYGYHFVIYQTEHLEKLIKANREKQFNVSFDEEKVQKLLMDDVVPRIRMEPERCLITLYTFYAMGGIYKTTWSISRMAPYRVQVVEKEKLADNEVRGFY